MENHVKYSKFKIRDRVGTSKYKNKVCTPNWSEDFFVLKYVKNTIQCNRRP